MSTTFTVVLERPRGPSDQWTHQHIRAAIEHADQLRASVGDPFLVRVFASTDIEIY